MLGDELSQKAVSVTFKSTQVTLRNLLKVLDYLLSPSSSFKNLKQGYQSLKSLNQHNHALQDIPLSSQDLRQFKHELRSYGVDYAVKKDLSQSDTFKIYFKGKDVVQIENALKNYMAKQFSREKKPSIRERMTQAIEKSKAMAKDPEIQPKEIARELSL